MTNFLFSVSERTSDKMYIPVAGANCYRRLNATHSTGCSCESHNHDDK